LPTNDIQFIHAKGSALSFPAPGSILRGRFQWKGCPGLLPSEAWAHNHPARTEPRSFATPGWGDPKRSVGPVDRSFKDWEGWSAEISNRADFHSLILDVLL